MRPGGGRHQSANHQKEKRYEYQAVGRESAGFTLIEIIAVLVLIGILAAVAVPKYMDLTVEASKKAAQGQIAEVKGRLATALASYMLTNNGAKPANGAALVSAANTQKADTCPTSNVDEGDFTFKCTGDCRRKNSYHYSVRCPRNGG